MDEIWKPIEGHPFYEVSNLGRVRSLDQPVESRPGVSYVKPGTILKLQVPRNKYPIVAFGKKRHLVHRLVAKVFLPPPTSDEQNTVNHKDGTRNNNVPSNLEWATMAENHTHAFRTLGRKPTTPMEKSTMIGGVRYASRSAAARAIGVSVPAVMHALRNGGRVRGREVSNA